MAFQWEQFDRLLLYSVIHLISCAIASICDCSTATFYRRRRFVCYENHVFVAFIQLNARCTAMKWSNVECKCENYEYFIDNHSPIYRYQFDCIAPLTTLIRENWLYRRRAPRIELITSNAMIYTWSYLIDLSRIIFFFASFVMVFITADNEVNWFALHSYDRPHRSREILFDLFMLIESANDWIET